MTGEVSQVLLLAVVAVTLPNTKAGLEASGDDVTVHPPVDSSGRPRSPYHDFFDDPFWNQQWYAQDLNLVPVYRMGITGKKVVVTVVDDGVDEAHPDLKERCRNDLSYDLCMNRKGSTPHDKRDIYGTMAAGIIAMQANNKKCGVGVAYDAKIAGLQYFCHYFHSYYEAFAIGYRPKEIDISLNLWGGSFMTYHGDKTEAAFSVGRNLGRKGKGLIYVFAGGINGHLGANCCGNSLLQVPEVIVVNGASPSGKRLSYGERCSAIMATAYAWESEGDSPGLVSTLPGGSCGVQKESGTWSAGALAAGVIALVLEARPELTYRDVMHIIAMGSEVAPLADNKNTWHINRKGFWFSNDFGFGLLNAENMVKLARRWALVPKKSVCNGKVVFQKPIQFDFGQTKVVKFDITGCNGKNNAVNYLEHVVVWLNIGYKLRGALQVNLVSPQGTDATIMEPQTADSKASGLNNWRVTSLHSWGESPKGCWSLRVTAKDKPKGFWSLIGTKVEINSFKIELHGTASPPEYHGRLPRTYAEFHLADGRSSKGPLLEPNSNKQHVDEEIRASALEY